MEKKIEMFQTLMKANNGGYLAVLSDNSVDRDGEIVSGKALSKVYAQQKGKIPILLNHENKIENLVGEWVNRRMENRDGHDAFVSEPKFYMSNPKAQMIKGILDDGAECGISIGAIVKDTEIQKIDGKDTTVYTDIELLEASFVAIPSNRHGAAMAVAKSFKNKMEVLKMDEEMKKDFESKIDVLDKSLAERDESIVELSKQLEELKADKEKEAAAMADLNKQLEEKTKEADKVAELVKEIEDLKALSLNKGNFEVDVDKAAAEAKEQLDKGYLPIMRE